MSDTLTFAELDEQHVELLPPRTVMSMFMFPSHHSHGGSEHGGGNGQGGLGLNLLNVNLLGHQTNSAGDGVGGSSHHSSSGGTGTGGLGINALNLNVLGNQTNSAGNGIGGRG